MVSLAIFNLIMISLLISNLAIITMVNLIISGIALISLAMIISLT